MSHYSGDDIAKFMWMVRIAANEFPVIKEDAFYNHNGQYMVDDSAS